MFVDTVRVATRARLVVLADHAALLEAAKLLGGQGVDIVVVCGSNSPLAGVITKTDIVDQRQGSRCTTAVDQVMTYDLIVSQPGDRLEQLWQRMLARRLHTIPVIDENNRPLGVLKAREFLQALLQEAESEESSLREYVMTAGYH